MALSIQGSNQALTFKPINTGKVITAVDNLLTGFPVMSRGAQVIRIFPIQHLTHNRNLCKQITMSVSLLWFDPVEA